LNNIKIQSVAYESQFTNPQIVGELEAGVTFEGDHYNGGPAGRYSMIKASLPGVTMLCHDRMVPDAGPELGARILCVWWQEDAWCICDVSHVNHISHTITGLLEHLNRYYHRVGFSHSSARGKEGSRRTSNSTTP
jgi:hypothetical protein